MRDEYWASVETSDLADAAWEQAERYYKACDESGQRHLWERAVRTYYGLDGNGGWKSSVAVQSGGEQGELVGYRVNDFGSLCRYIHTLITGNRPVLEARAANDDPDSYEQTILARGLLEYYWQKKRIEASMVQAAMWSLYWGEGWHLQYWDVFGGQPYGQDDEGRVIYEGDVRAVPLRAIDVIRDPDARFEGDARPKWMIARVKENRYELAARYPQHAQAILDAETVHAADKRARLSTPASRSSDSDEIYYYLLFHERSVVLPAGRHAIMVGDAVVYDGPLPYRSIPLYEIMPGVQEQSCWGHTHMWDALSPQECLDAAASTIQTNYDAFGVVNILSRQGSIVHTSDLAGGLRNVEYMGDTKPETLNLLPASKEGMDIAQFSRKNMEMISGVNETARGVSSPSTESGAHAALLQAMSVQSNSGLHAGYGRAVERAGQGLLEMLQDFVSNERTAEIVGKDRMPRMQQWTGKSIEKVASVHVEIAPAISQTIAHKRDMADKFLEQGFIQSPDEYAQVIATGRLEPIYSDDRDEWRAINAENEVLSQGQEVPALITDRHTMHIRGHRQELSDPRIRLNPGLREAVLAHIEQHLMLREQSDPDLLAIIGEPPPAGGPPPGPEGPPPGPEGPPPGPPPGGPEEGGQPAVIPALEAQGAGGEGMPNLPTMPTNPGMDPEVM